MDLLVRGCSQMGLTLSETLGDDRAVATAITELAMRLRLDVACEGQVATSRDYEILLDPRAPESPSPPMRTVAGADQPAPPLFRQDRNPFPYLAPTTNAAVLSSGTITMQ